jgi:hypothetical protein
LITSFLKLRIPNHDFLWLLQRKLFSIAHTPLGRLLPGAFPSDLAENKIACIHDEFTLLKPNQGTLLQSVNDLN